jgi:hypothetical protein
MNPNHTKRQLKSRKFKESGYIPFFSNTLAGFQLKQVAWEKWPLKLRSFSVDQHLHLGHHSEKCPKK